MLQVEGDPFAEAPDPPAVLADTLGSLARLGADADVTAAAILHALPAVEAQAASADRKANIRSIAALLEGQRAAVQVWSLHAEQHGHANSEGLRRLLLAIVRDLRVVLDAALAPSRAPAPGGQRAARQSNARSRNSRATSTRRSPTASASGS